MTVHRPHPITGPYPYGVRDATGDVVPRHPWADAHAVPLIERVPVNGSEVYDDPEDAILYDGCERCAQHASHPFDSLDDSNLAALWKEMIRVERDPTLAAHYRTSAEGQACRELYRVACILGRIVPMLDPWSWPIALHDEATRLAMFRDELAAWAALNDDTR